MIAIGSMGDSEHLCHINNNAFGIYTILVLGTEPMVTSEAITSSILFI